VMTKSPSDATERFFAELAERGHDPLLRKASGCVRFDIVDGRRSRRWYVTVDRGDIQVTRLEGKADCIMRAERSLAEKVVAGRLNAVAAVLRGDLEVEGDWRMLVLMQRLFPGPRASRRRKATA